MDLYYFVSFDKITGGGSTLVVVVVVVVVVVAPPPTAIVITMVDVLVVDIAHKYHELHVN
jgi:hypothetical protein